MKEARLPFVVVVCLAFAAMLHADARPISDAERAGVQAAADYLGRGPQSVVDKLSATSPLRKLPPQLVATEVETRLGPAKGAKWSMLTVLDALKDEEAGFAISYPSGLDEMVFFEMKHEGGQYRIDDIRIMAMPSKHPSLFPPAAPVTRSGGFNMDTIAGVAGVGAAVLALIAFFAMRFSGIGGRLLYLICIVAGAGALAIAAFKGDRLRVMPVRQNATAAESELQLSPLLALRSALAAGGRDVGVALMSARKEGPLGDVVRLWKAQWDFQQLRVPEVKRALDTFPVPSTIPLVEILRARVALVEGNPTDAVTAYQRAITAGPGSDALWIETSQALLNGELNDLGRRNLNRLMDLGTRDPGVYYVHAAAATSASELERELERAWNMYPAERADLVASGMLYSLVRKRGVTFMNLSAPREPSFASMSVSSRGIVLPPDCVARVSGDYLDVKSNSAELSVPGGAALAPAGTNVVGADEWSRLDDAEALADVPALVAATPSAASYIEPALRKRMSRSVTALAKRNRWQEVADLTNGITARAEFVPTRLFLLRARALQRIRRESEAKQLLADLADSPALKRRQDALEFEEIADMFASFDLFDRAGQMFDASRKLRPSPYADVRLQQIGMDKRLAEKYATEKTEHFEIKYPAELPSGFATMLAPVLEGELRRLQAVIPVAGFKPVTVNVVWWQDFKSVYTGSEDILGFYNGKITVPLAGVLEFPPEIVAIITHELAHAMISQATDSRAPRWFQEGLAQRVEMVPYAANPFNMYDDEKLLAVSVLDPVLTVSRDNDMVGEAYIVSEAVIRYIESQYGQDGVRRMIASYAANANTEEAIQAIAGVPAADFDMRFRLWGRSEKRVFENATIVRYDAKRPDDMTLPGAQPGQQRQRGKMNGGTLYPIRRH